MRSKVKEKITHEKERANTKVLGTTTKVAKVEQKAKVKKTKEKDTKTRVQVKEKVMENKVAKEVR